MVQSNVIVTYAPARRTVAVPPVRRRNGLAPKRVGMTLAGALLAGGAAFILGTFVRPDGTIREAGTAMQPRMGAAMEERAPAEASIEREASPAEPPAEVSSLPFLALVREPAPALRPAAAPLSAPAARPDRNAPPAGRVVMRAEHRPIAAPAATSAPAPAPEIDAAVSLAPVPPSDAPAGQRRDLAGFLNEQGLVLATETDAGGALPPVSEWDADDLVAAGDAAPSLAAAPEAEPQRDSLAFSSGGELAPSAAPGIASAAIVDLPPAEAETTVEVATLGASAPAIPDVEEISPAASPPLRLAAVSRALPPPSQAATEVPELAQVQSFPLTVVNGESLGAITMRDSGSTSAAIHLGALVELLKLKMPEREFTRLRTAAAADRFVTLDELRAAGIAVRHDARQDRLIIETR